MTVYSQTDSGLLNWKDYGGTGATIVLVHGLGGSLGNWEAVAPKISGLSRTVAVDLPGFGLSPPGADWSLETQAQALVDFIGGFDPPVILIGNSLGGLVAEAVAANHPHLVSALILVSPATPPRFPDPRLNWPNATRLVARATPGLGSALSRLDRQRFTPRQLVETSLDRIAYKKSRIPPHVLEGLVTTSATRYQLPWAVDAVPLAARAVARLWRHPSRFVAMIRKISAPTLVVHGLEDRIISPTSVEWLCSLRSDWELVQMEDTGHTPQLDAPVRFVETITPWLRTHLDG